MIIWRGNQPLEFFTGTNVCDCTPTLCFPVKNGDITEFQVDLSAYTGQELLLNSDLTPYIDGIADGATSGIGLLHSVTSSFDNWDIPSGGGANARWLIWNRTADTYGTITTVTSDTVLATSNDWTVGDLYAIFPWVGTGIVPIPKWTFDGNTITRTGTAGGDSIKARMYTGRGTGATAEQAECGLSMYMVTIAINATETANPGLIPTLASSEFLTPVVPQEFFVFYTPDLAINNVFELATNAGATGIVIESLSVKEISTPALVIKDCNTGAIVFEDYNNSSAYIEWRSGSLTNANAGKALISIDWERIGLANGCYQVCLVHANEDCRNYICNGGFSPISGNATTTVANKMQDNTERFNLYDIYFQHTTILNITDVTYAQVTGMDSPTQLAIDADRFTIGELWRITNCWTVVNEADPGWTMNGTAALSGGGSNTMYQVLEIPLKVDVRYTLTFDLTIASGTLSVEYDAGSLVDQVLATETTSGAKSITISGIAMTRLTFNSDDAAVITSLDNVAISVVFSEAGTDYFDDCVIFSECVCLDEHPCTMLIEGTNAGNGYAYVAGDDIDVGGGNTLNFTDFIWSMALRVLVHKWHPRMKDKGLVQFITDSASGVVGHSFAYPVWKLVMGQMPSNRLIALFNMLRMDLFHVDGIRYFADFDELEPPWDDWSDSAEVELDLREEFVKFENVAG